MAQVNKVEKITELDRWGIVRFQFLTYCFFAKITASDAQLDCLTLLALCGEQELNSFCQNVCDEKIFKSAQTVRNAIGQAEKHSLVIKQGKSKKKIWVNPSLKIQTNGSIFLDYKIIRRETEEN